MQTNFGFFFFHLKVDSNEFKQGVNQLADVLQVPKHPSHLVTLEGVCNLLKERFNEEAVKKISQQQQPQSIPIQFDKLNFGMDIKDPNFSQAANVLRFLFIHDLRSLQTKINECLVSVQALTANPKTDTKLGKVGHWLMMYIESRTVKLHLFIFILCNAFMSHIEGVYI